MIEQEELWLEQAKLIVNRNQDQYCVLTYTNLNSDCDKCVIYHKGQLTSNNCKPHGVSIAQEFINKHTKKSTNFAIRLTDKSHAPLLKKWMYDNFSGLENPGELSMDSTRWYYYIIDNILWYRSTDLPIVNFTDILKQQS